MTQDQQKVLFNEMRSNIEKYIVKPQKEGGGNNYYNEDILMLLPPEDKLEQLGDILKQSIIMERIFPPELETYILHENQLKKLTCVSEISVYGIILSDDKNIHFNKSVGLLVRTKETTNQEGGVVTGFSAIDLPFLVDLKLDQSSTTPLKYEKFI